MPKKRAFSAEGIQQKKDDYHGSCRYVRTRPDIKAQNIKSVNLELSFDEAMQLSLSIQAGLLALNRYNRSKKDGREMGLCLSVKTEANTISVLETKVKLEAK
ncbi:hypothetical protein [uncultured Rubinisphaera sp.]|uniref:hypothetical protein n=1 Tax=uncultured Rubinisphaera sp. TaxID=1678686 RepID=UPI0030D7BC28